MRIFFICFLFIKIGVTSSNFKVSKYVNTFIGTKGEGHIYPGAVRPWGMVSVNPHTNYTSPIGYLMREPVAPSGYHFGEKKIKGFGQTHLSGVGCPELGAPVVYVSTGKRDFHMEGSPFQDEVSSPGYYSVRLGDGVQVEVSATKRVGVHRFTIPQGQAFHIFISSSKNLSWGGGNGYIEFIGDKELQGWAQTGKFCNSNNAQKVYFAARVNRRPREHGTFIGSMDESSQVASGKAHGYWSFDQDNSVELYVGISYVSMANALLNLEEEMENKGFAEVLNEAKDAWEATLSRIQVKGGTPRERTLFYTSLYRTLIHPNIISDVNGDYPTYGKAGVGNNKFYERFTVFSMWDTYRSLHALLSLFFPEKQQAMLLTLEDMANEAGHIPQWELLGSEVNMMVGDPAVSIIAEGVSKGFKFKNLSKLFDILYKGVNSDSDTRRPGNQYYKKLGYIPHKTKGVWGAVSTTLEYAFNDWSLAQIAEKLGREEEKNELLKRAGGWKFLFDKTTFTLRPKDEKGKFIKSFNPHATKGDQILKQGGPGFVEGSAYQYAYMVPHGILDLIELHGGEDIFMKNLENVFNKKEFTLWNEPDMSYPYLFTYVQKGEAITQKLVLEILSKSYENSPDGLPGNDDVGALSAWYVFSALGFYPVNPVSSFYRLGMPLFYEINISWREKNLKITRRNSLAQNISFNGIMLNEPSINHLDLSQGGTLDFSN